MNTDTGEGSNSSRIEESSHLNQSHQRARLNRSKHGCLVCRQKRIKCSESKPVCAQCIAGSRTCTWPSGVKAEQIRTVPQRVDSDRPIAIRPAPVKAVDVSGSPPMAMSAPQKPSPPRARILPKGVPFLKTKEHSLESQYWKDYPGISPQSMTSAASMSATDPPARNFGAREKDANENAPRQSLGFQPAAATVDPNVLFSAVSFRELKDSCTIIDIPRTVSLAQFCFASSSSTSTTLSFVRNTYLCKLANGPFVLAGLTFASSMISVIDELDPNAQLALRDPMRLQILLQNCAFQEAFVQSLRSTFGSPVHLIRTWVTSLFLMTMSLELGLTTLGLHHLAVAITSFRQADVKVLLKSSVTPLPHRKLLTFLAEGTYRLSSIISLLRGDRPAILKEEMPDITQALILDKITRSTMSMRIQAFDILHSYIMAHDPISRNSSNKMVDHIAHEVRVTQDLLTKSLEGIQVSTANAMPFELKTYSDPAYAHPAMALIFIRLLLVNIMDRNLRSSLISQFFMTLHGLLIDTRHRPSTLDAFMILSTATYLDRGEQRNWLVDSLRTGLRNGYDLLLPVETCIEVITSVWRSIDARGPYSEENSLIRDFDGLRDLQTIVRQVIRGHQ